MSIKLAKSMVIVFVSFIGSPFIFEVKNKSRFGFRFQVGFSGKRMPLIEVQFQESSLQRPARGQFKLSSLFYAARRRDSNCDDVANRHASLLLYIFINQHEEPLLPGNDEGFK